VRRILVLAVLLAGCDMRVAPPGPGQCVEFNHDTYHKGVRVTCRMVWCEQVTNNGNGHSTGGAAVLWCDDDGPNVDMAR